MTNTYLDILPDDLIIKIFDKRADDINKDILKIEKDLLKIANIYFKDLEIIEDTDDDGEIITNISYDCISYCLDEYLLDLTGFEEICLFEFLDDKNIFLSPVIKNGTWLDVLISTNLLYIEVLDFIRYIEDIGDMEGYDSDFYEDHKFLEVLTPFNTNQMKKRIKNYNLNILGERMLKNDNIIYFEIGKGS